MSIETNIYKRLVINRLNEYATYIDNNQVADEVARGIRACSFEYDAIIEFPNKDEVPCRIQVEVNEDDISAIETDNVVYVYLNSDKIDFKIINPVFKENVINREYILNSSKNFKKVHPKCWKDKSKLYLLKLNKNSGFIGRFNPIVDKFKRQLVNYNTSDTEYIARDLLTKDYLIEYFEVELNTLISPVDQLITTDLDKKFEEEKVIKFNV